MLRQAAERRAGGEPALLTDDELTARAKDGDQDAFSLLVARYEGRILRLAYHFTGDGNDARDVAQETFLRAYRYLHTVEGGRRMSAWLYAIARNAAIDALRRKKQNEALVGERSDDEVLGPDELAIRREEARVLQQAMHGMPAHYRDVLELRYMHGRRYREIAVALNLPIGTVKTHLRRAKQRLGQATAEQFRLAG